MNGRQLAEEFEQASERIRLPHLARLRALGVAYPALARLNAVQPTVGFNWINPLPSGLFAFEEECEPMVIQAVCAADPEPGDPGIIDLIAWRTTEPSKWWWRCGTGFALGCELLGGDAPVHVVATPCDWLAAAGQALCILDWAPSSPVWSLLRLGPRLIFRDTVLRERVRNALVQSVPMPMLEFDYAA